MMKRREFITLLGGTAVWPIVARAQQQAAIPVIGYLDLLEPQTGALALQFFRRALAELGYVEGRNISIEFRWAEGERERLPALAADLVRRQVAVIVTPSDPTIALVAKAATSTVPIVFTSGNDPVRIGLVPNFNRPGGNITGVSYFVEQLGPKRLELLRELVPQRSLIAVLGGAVTSPGSAQLTELDVAATKVGQQLMPLLVETPSDISEAFAKMAQRHVSGLIVNGSRVLSGRTGEVVALAAHYRIPTMYYYRSFVDAGGLMSYGDERYESWRQAAIYVARVLKGEKPGDLPVVQPTRFKLVINLKTANALGLTIPPLLRALATEVIE